MPSVTLLLIAIASSIGWFPYSELRAEPGYKGKSGNIASISPQFIVYTSHAQLKLQYDFNMKPPVLVTTIPWSQPNSQNGFKVSPLLKTHASPGG